MKFLKKTIIAVGILACLGINQSNASAPSLDGKNQSFSFAAILNAAVSGGKVKYHRYQKGQEVTPNKDLWKMVCDKKCSAMSCGNEYDEGAVCIAFCPIDTIKYCASAFKSNFAKNKQPEELKKHIQDVSLSVVMRAANTATTQSYKGTDPAAKQAALKENVGKVTTAFKSLAGK